MTYTPADWTHLLATRFSLKAEQLPKRTPSVVRSPLSFAAVPADVMASEHSLSLQALLGTAPLALDVTPWELRVVCRRSTLGVSSSRWSPMGFLPSPLSMVTVALLCNFSSFQPSVSAGA